VIAEPLVPSELTISLNQFHPVGKTYVCHPRLVKLGRSSLYAQTYTFISVPPLAVILSEILTFWENYNNRASWQQSADKPKRQQFAICKTATDLLLFVLQMYYHVGDLLSLQPYLHAHGGRISPNYFQTPSTTRPQLLGVKQHNFCGPSGCTSYSLWCLSSVFTQLILLWCALL